MVTLIHTLLHFVTLFCTHLVPTASAAASIRIQGVSKSHYSALTGHNQRLCRVCVVYTHIRKPLQRGLYTYTVYYYTLYTIQVLYRELI